MIDDCNCGLFSVFVSVEEESEEEEDDDADDDGRTDDDEDCEEDEGLHTFTISD